MSSIKRTKHAVYDTKYHLVWIPKVRKRIFTPGIADYVKEIFQEIAEVIKWKPGLKELMRTLRGQIFHSTTLDNQASLKTIRVSQNSMAKVGQFWVAIKMRINHSWQ